MENELPKGWTEVSLEELLVSLESGSRPKGGVRGIADGVPSIGGEHLKYDGGFEFKNIKYVPKSFAYAMNKGQIKVGDILIVKDGATTGKTSFVTKSFPFKDAVVNEHVFICRASKEISSRYLFWYLYSEEGSKRVLENFKGSAQGGINKTFAENTLVPIAPLAEQQRIVAKLDAILARVNNCKTRLDKIPTLLKNFRQSVLAAAISGELTKEWREKNDDLLTAKEIIKQIKEKRKSSKPRKLAEVENHFNYDIPETWAWCQLDDITTLITDGKHGDCKDEPNSGYYFLSAKDIKNGKLLYSNARQINYPEFFETHRRTNLEAGDICVVNTGATVGKSAIAIESELTSKTTFQKSVAVIKVEKEFINSTFINYLIRLETNKILLTSKGSAINNWLLSEMRAMWAPLPPTEEQKEIVRKVEELFHFADSIEARYQKAKAWFDKIPQAILAKAFKGQLVPQHETDEPASVLLERIKKEKQQPTKPKTKTTSKTKKLYQENDVVSMVAEG